MRFRLGTAALGVATLLAACTASEGSIDMSSAALDSNDQKASYGIGLNVGSQISETKDRLDRMAFLRGVEDALQGSDPAIEPEELQMVLSQFAEEMQAASQAAYEASAATNLEEGAAFLAENGGKEGVMTTESGLQYEVIAQGDGSMPTAADQIQLHYRGTLIDGSEFDSSYGGEPAQFGVGGVIPGFGEALMLMAVGSHYKFVIPSEIAYGPQGSQGVIGPNATLIFEIELLAIVEN
ncbi:MAG: FKBP-type peptidyl-prolyl cis-trans isomerase [Gemmatimonadales bacterium]|nr:FKBP-type peptidyl-prolyl cis-trans isomerase [Gemmatimonadales bacterium]MBT6696266.1 FKBP-type peptidyl-prolyl cis-trans isomerase [Gemmatimonadales bacterium]